MRSVENPNLKIRSSQNDIQNVSDIKKQQEETPARILYGKREKTKKEIEKEKSYPKYIEDFSQPQLLYADKEIIRKAEEASKGRNGNVHAWLEDKNEAENSQKRQNLSQPIIDNDINPLIDNDIKPLIDNDIKPLIDNDEIGESDSIIDENVVNNLEFLKNIKSKEQAEAYFENLVNRASNLTKESIMYIVHNTPPEITTIFVGKFYVSKLNKIAQKFIGPDAAGMLDISHPEINDPSYIKDAIRFTNCYDRRLSKYLNKIEFKTKVQFASLGYDVKNIEGLYFPPNSIPSKNITQDVYFKQFLRENKNKLLNNTKDRLSIEFKTGNMYYAHHLVDVLDYEFDNQGNLLMIIFDTNDYNLKESPKLIQAGRMAMERGELIPLFILKEVYVPKAELDKIWK